MAVPRPLLLALIGVVLLATTFLASQNARNSVDATQSSAPVERVEVAEPPSASSNKPGVNAEDKGQKGADQPKQNAQGEDKSQGDKGQSKGDKGQSKGADQNAAEKQAAERRRRRLRRQRLSGPMAVQRAVQSGKVAVLFLTNPRAADDTATERAVNGVKGKHVAVFKDSVRNLKRYGSIVAAADVTQSPAVVIVTRKDARVLEGFIDEATLSQEVADARR